MINIYKEPKKIIIDDYTEDTKNEGKVAIINNDNSSLFAEGDGDKDWVEIELLCEKMNEKKQCCYVLIIPKKNRLIKTYDWSTARWEN